MYGCRASCLLGFTFLHTRLSSITFRVREFIVESLSAPKGVYKVKLPTLVRPSRLKHNRDTLALGLRSTLVVYLNQVQFPRPNCHECFRIIEMFAPCPTGTKKANLILATASGRLPDNLSTPFSTLATHA